MSKVVYGGIWAVLLARSCLSGETNRFPEFRLETARAYLQTLSRAFPAQTGTNAQTFYVQAWLQSQLGEKVEAKRLAKRALESDPRRADIEVFLAHLLIREDHLEEAAAALRDAVKIDPSVKDGYRRLGLTLERLGDSKGAFEAFTEAVRRTPDDPLAQHLLGKSLYEQSQLLEAVDHLEKSCKLDPESANPYYTLFQVQSKLGNQEAAQKALATFKRLKQVEKQGMGTGADDGNYDNEKDMRSFTASVHVELAGIVGSQGQTDLAEDHLSQALRISPTYTNALASLGNLYVRTRRFVEARPLLEELTRLRPQNASDAVNLGTLLLQLKHSRGAVAQLKRAIQLDPNQPQALNNLARFYLGNRVELGEALGLAQRLVAISPEAANYDLLGWAYYANGKTKDAIAATAQAVDKDPGNPAYQERYRRLVDRPAGTR